MNDPLNHQARDASRGQTETAAKSAVIAQPRVFHFFLAIAHPVPRIIFLLPDDFLETAADKEFHSVEAGLIHVTQDRMHHAGGHVVRPETGVAVA